MIKYIILAVVFFLTDTLSYKYIRKIDKKERKKIDQEELDHVNTMLQKYKELDSIPAYQKEMEEDSENVV